MYELRLTGLSISTMVGAFMLDHSACIVVLRSNMIPVNDGDLSTLFSIQGPTGPRGRQP